MKKTGEYACNCTGLFVGPYCQWKNPCHTGPVPRCQNAGTCAVTQVSPHSPPGFSCQCPLGFTASLCEIPISNACDSKPCQNGGTCWLHNIKEHRCNCAPGFTGPNCELEDHCASGPCKNGAECASKDDSYECTCAPGFTGTTCSEDIEECSTTEPCVHGQCVNTHGSYACICEPGYTGKNCEMVYVPCDPSPCMNSGKCMQIDDLNYECKCKSGMIIYPSNT